MKRFICLLLSALMLTACNGSGNTPADSDQSNDQTVETQIIEQELDPNAEYVTGNYTRVDGETIQKYPRLTNLPTLYITLDDGLELGDVQHGIYSSATYSFVDQHLEKSYYELPLEIKGRGNYSWSFAQKPYTLKLADSADFLGMGSDSKWVLVTVSSDKSMMHNYLTQKLAAQLGLRGTVENEYVDVVVNGEYSGTYVLTESIEIDDSRIDVPSEAGILFEIQKVYRHECDLCVELERNDNHDHTIHLQLQEYKGQDIDQLSNRTRSIAQNELDRFFAKVEDAMKSGDYAAIEQVIDVDSFVNWFLLNEFTRNYDSSFVSSVYCYINEEGKLYMGPCWDYDTCYGIQFPETDGSYVRDTPWYRWLFNNSPEFVQKVEERWAQLREEDGLIDQFIASIDTTVEYISMSEKMQHHLYPHSELYDVPYDEAVQYFKDWISYRIEWMDYEYSLED